MTDRYCIRASRISPCRDRSARTWIAGAALHGETRGRVRDAVDIVELIGTRTELRRAGPTPTAASARFTMSARRRSRHAVEEGLLLLRLSGGWRRLHVRSRDPGPRLPGGAGDARDRYNVTLEPAEEDPRAAERRLRRARLSSCSSGRAATTSATSGSPMRRRGRASISPDAASMRRCCGASAWVMRRARGTGCCSPRGGARFSEEELLDAGLVQRSRDRRAGSTTASARGSCSRSATGARGSSGLALGRCGPRHAKYLNSSGGEIFHKGERLFGEHLALAAAAKAGGVVACEGYTDVIAMHQAGVENCVGSWAPR